MFVHVLKILVLFLNKGLEMNAFLVFFYPIHRKNYQQISCSPRLYIILRDLIAILKPTTDSLPQILKIV